MNRLIALEKSSSNHWIICVGFRKGIWFCVITKLVKRFFLLREKKARKSENGNQFFTLFCSLSLSLILLHFMENKSLFFPQTVKSSHSMRNINKNSWNCFKIHLNGGLHSKDKQLNKQKLLSVGKKKMTKNAHNPLASNSHFCCRELKIHVEKW